MEPETHVKISIHIDEHHGGSLRRITPGGVKKYPNIIVLETLLGVRMALQTSMVKCGLTEEEALASINECMGAP